MITVVCGRPGTGKTVYLVGRIMNFLSAHIPVYTNIEIKLSKNDKRRQYLHIINGLDDIIKVRHGKVVLDEVQTYLNSRNWDSLDTKFQLLLQQHRKRGLDILGATQSIKRADVVFRELVQVFLKIYKIISFKFPFSKYAIGLFLLREYDPDSIESSTGKFEALGLPWIYVVDPYTFAIYDTTQEYAIETQLGKREMREYEYVEKVVVTPRLVSKSMIESVFDEVESNIESRSVPITPVGRSKGRLTDLLPVFAGRTKIEKSHSDAVVVSPPSM